MTFEEWWKWQYENPKLRNYPGNEIQLIYAYSKAAWDAGQQAERDAYAARANAEREDSEMEYDKR